MGKILHMGPASIRRVTYWRAGSIALSVETDERTYQTARRAASLSGESVESIYARYAAHLIAEYPPPSVKARRLLPPRETGYPALPRRG